MAVTYYKLDQNTTDGPSTGSASSINRGYFGVSGTLESLILHYKITLSTATNANTFTDLANMITRFRLVIDGQVIHDWNSSFASGVNIPSLTGYWVNSIGGRSLTQPHASNATSLEAWIAIPCGVVIQNPTPRFELMIGLGAGTATFGGSFGGTISSEVEYWGRYNSATPMQVRTLPQTSFNHAANAIENVSVKCDTSVLPGSTVLGVMVANDSNADELGNQGIRVLSLSDFGMEATMHRLFNGDTGNGILFAGSDPSDTSAGPGTASPSAQSYASELAGGLFIPTYSLSLRGTGQLRLIVDSSAATTRFYHPIVGAPIQAKEMSPDVQTKMIAGNPAQTIAARTEN